MLSACCSSTFKSPEAQLWDDAQDWCLQNTGCHEAQWERSNYGKSLGMDRFFSIKIHAIFWRKINKIHELATHCEKILLANG